MPEFALRYAPHLGYVTPTPLFGRSVGSDDPYAHARFAAEQGFAGLFHPWIGARPTEEIARFKTGLDDFGLEAGTIAYAPWDDALRPFWVSRRAEDRELLLEHVEASARLARELGARNLAVLISESGEAETKQPQMATARENLRYAAEIAERYDVVLGLEPMVAVPGMLLQSAYAAAELIDKVDNPFVRLIFDTGHVASMDGSILEAQAALERLVCIYQLADMPGRREPGAGDLELGELLARLIAKGYRGLVELEHDWSSDSPETERAGIGLLQQLDSEAGRLAGETAEAAAADLR